MTVNKELLEGLAHLARLEFEEKDAEKMVNDLNDILAWVEKLNEVDTSGIEPILQMSEENNVLRADEAGGHLEHDKALKNAPKKDSNYFRVPKVLD